MINDKTDIIHLDLYFESDQFKEHLNKNFDNYLKVNGIKPAREVPKDQWAALKIFSKFENAVENFAKAQFAKGRNVICEGIQIFDGGLLQEHSHYSDKPIIILQTPASKSIKHALDRDQTKFNNLTSMKEYLKSYSQMHGQIKELTKTVKAK